MRRKPGGAAPRPDRSRRWLKAKYPTLYRVYVQKQRHKRRPRIAMGTDHRPYLTFDFDFVIGRTYASLDPPAPLSEQELAAVMMG